MTEVRLPQEYLEYRDAAAGTLSRSAGPEACDAFGLGDVFSAAADAGDLAPVLAFLEAQGAAGAVTPALGLMALLGDAEQGWQYAAPYGRRGHCAVAGWVPGGTVVLDRPGDGLVEVSGGPVPAGGVQADPYLTLFAPPGGPERVLVPEPQRSGAAAAALARLRLGVGAEVLGVTQRLLDEAVAHAKVRTQFGAPIGDFQAVQHLLAWAATEVHQLRALLDVAVVCSGPEPDPVLALAVKAMAGRTGHAVTQAAVQVTGAISFTAEHGLPARQQRVLALDQLGGASADLVLALGGLVRETGAVPDLFTLPSVVA